MFYMKQQNSHSKTLTRNFDLLGYVCKIVNADYMKSSVIKWLLTLFLGEVVHIGEGKQSEHILVILHRKKT